MDKKEPRKVKGLNNLLSALAERAKRKKHNKLFAGCLKTRTMLDYLYDRLTPEEAGAVKKHLGKCHRCAEELELMRESERIVSE
jgi:anti-sigma factor RsiW